MPKLILNEATDEEILDEFDSARSSMSYYNAAEGNWSAETEGRTAAYAYLREVSDELDKRNLEGRPGTYLC